MFINRGAWLEGLLFSRDFEVSKILDCSPKVNFVMCAFCITFTKLLPYFNDIHKKHIDASVKERPQTLLVPSEEMCKCVLCNKHI